ncbi:hypothetical protein [Peribacillus acanthi]|uniref:hypothetical protein n=1 Tax=Peribacillus acanthi TaxID=2171554 RepID=UPI000D3ED926|nr:hypothetical protein [Peribacillus acanthi]
MRFLIEYKDFISKETENVNLRLLDTFLNEHLIGIFHGYTFECILIRFINHAPPSKKFKLKTLYGTIAEVEISGSFKENNKLNIDDFHQGLSKIEEAIQKVSHIPKEPFDYQGEGLLNDYKSSLIFAPKTTNALILYAQMQNEIIFQNNAKRADTVMYSYTKKKRPLTKKIVGIRIYDHFEKGTLAPYDYIYSVLFSNLLRRNEVRLPGYDEIYISIGETMEQAKQDIALEEWFKYTYTTLDITQYQKEENKSQMVFESVCRGLRLISEFDHLERDKIEKVIRTIEQQGTDLELIYSSKENKNIRAEIIYQVPQNHLAKAEYKLKVTDLNSGKVGIAHIDFIDTYWAPYSFGKIVLNKQEIIIKGRESLRAEISRQQDKLPDEYRFKIVDIVQS